MRPYVGILLGREDGSFDAQQALTASADYTFSPVIGDFNGDGIDDLTGLGGLKHLEAYVSRPTGLDDLVTGDVNGDGLADVVALSQDFDESNCCWAKRAATTSDRRISLPICYR